MKWLINELYDSLDTADIIDEMNRYKSVALHGIVAYAYLSWSTLCRW